MLSALVALRSALVDGAVLKEVYAATTQSLVDQGQEKMVLALPKGLGFLTGLEFRDGSHVISAKCNATAKVRSFIRNQTIDHPN